MQKKDNAEKENAAQNCTGGKCEKSRDIS